MLDSYYTYNLKIFSPILWAFFLSWQWPIEIVQKSFKFLWSQIYVFFVTCDFDAISKKPYPKWGLCLLAPMFSPKSFIDTAFIFKSPVRDVPLSEGWRGWEGVKVFQMLSEGSRTPGSCFTATAFCTSILVLQVYFLICKMGEVLIVLVRSSPSAPVRIRIKRPHVYGDSRCTQDR